MIAKENLGEIALCLSSIFLVVFTVLHQTTIKHIQYSNFHDRNR